MEDFFIDGNYNPDYQNCGPTVEEMCKLMEESLMKSEYKKLTTEELTSYGIKLNDTKISHLLSIYNDFFDKAIVPYKCLLIVDSEYNDCTYDNKLMKVIFYDKENNELIPLKTKSREFHTLNYYEYDINISGETREQIEDEVVLLVIPDLYIKV